MAARAGVAARLKRGVVVMDGGFSTHCEAKGADLSIGKLWSARLIADSPETIKAVHTDFMAAGSDLIGTASYQGTVRGFVDAGSTPEEAEQLLTRAVALATSARDEFWEGLGAEARAARGAQPLVGACIGPYGGYLADGSEYSGSYGLAAEPQPEPEPQGEGGQGGGGYGLARPQHAGSMSREALMSFHREQVTVLAAAGADVLLFETLPCALEAKAIADLLSADFPEATAIVSFSCKDESCLNSGEPFAPALAAIEGCDQIVAVGVNCTPPHLIAPLLRSALTATAKPLVACKRKDITETRI